MRKRKLKRKRSSLGATLDLSVEHRAVENLLDAGKCGRAWNRFAIAEFTRGTLSGGSGSAGAATIKDENLPRAMALYARLNSKCRCG